MEKNESTNRLPTASELVKLKFGRPGKEHELASIIAKFFNCVRGTTHLTVDWSITRRAGSLKFASKVPGLWITPTMTIHSSEGTYAIHANYFGKSDNYVGYLTGNFRYMGWLVGTEIGKHFPSNFSNMLRANFPELKVEFDAFIKRLNDFLDELEKGPKPDVDTDQLVSQWLSNEKNNDKEKQIFIEKFTDFLVKNRSFLELPNDALFAMLCCSPDDLRKFASLTKKHKSFQRIVDIELVNHAKKLGVIESVIKS